MILCLARGTAARRHTQIVWSRLISGASFSTSQHTTPAHVQGNATAEEIKIRKAEKKLQVLFSDGTTFSYPAEYLRVMSPSADTRARVVSGRRHVGILNVEPVGNYAIRIHFDDLHSNGIYSWPYLYDLGEHKFSHMRSYIRRLKERGLTREPQRSTPAKAGQ